jgi:hypothetical protein
MAPRKRTHLINALMDEAHLMMGVLEKAMEGERSEARHPALHETPRPHGPYSLEDEHTSWGKILRTLTEIYTELAQIEKAEQHRREWLTASA